MEFLKQHLPAPVKHALKPLYLRVLPAPTAFIVLTRGRTGSNLLISLLGTHPQARLYNELFSQQILETEEYRRKLNEAGAPSYVRDCFRRQDTEKAIGAKILYYQIESEYAERYGIPSLPEVAAYLKNKPQLRVIHLKRRNHLRTVVSWMLARQTNQWARHSEAEKMNDEVKISLTPQECEKEFRILEAWEQKYDLFFKDHPVFTIFYEDLVADIVGKMNDIQDFLGLQRYPLTPGTKKQTSKPISEVISNYSELSEYFRNTRWVEYFS